MIRLRPCAVALTVVSLAIYLFMHGMVLAADSGPAFSPPKTEYIAGILGKMKAVYAQAEDYQMETEVKVYLESQIVDTKRFLYTFKKPDHIRIDMESPNAGMVLVYPDGGGKVVVKPGKLLGFLKLHLSPDNVLLRNTAGQRIDHTDIGLLIKQIEHSLTDRRHGEIKVSEQNSRVLIEVLAEDHFLSGVLTIYRFSIDKIQWLPVEVWEFTPNSILKREVRFRNVRTSIGVPESFFQIDGGKP